MVLIIVVNGPGRSGKDTFVELTAARYTCGPHRLHSTVDTVKLAAEHFGADEAIYKGEKERRLWSDLKEAYIRYNDGPFNEIVELAASLEQENPDKHPLLFTMVREPKEIAKLKNRFGNQAVTVIVTADDRIEHIPDNHADQGVFDFDYDFRIQNNATIDELKEKAKNFAGYLSNLIHTP